MSDKKSSSIGTPLSDVEIDITLVYSLLSNQHPNLMHLLIHLVDAGWDNVMFRLGNQLSVRLPRRKAAATLIENEQTWLPVLAGLVHQSRSHLQECIELEPAARFGG
ncbi:hypothetical protein [uncultured Nostoc sp.]|uniref:hypothetical protein n=1 Tax=uncultured Nostoc sp. TaxID=340711 RepID=UPI0035C95B7D